MKTVKQVALLCCAISLNLVVILQPNQERENILSAREVPDAVKVKLVK